VAPSAPVYPALGEPLTTRIGGKIGPVRTRRRLALRLLGAALVLVAACGRPDPAPRTTGTTEVTRVATTVAGPVPPASTAPGDAVLSGFVAFGDFGGGPAQIDVARAMDRWAAAGHKVDALVTTGDNVYDVAEPHLFEAQLDRPYRWLRSGRPMWATLGNHDVAGGYGDEELAHLGLPPLPYAKELPGVQLLFVDANRPDDAQARWLDQHLGAPGPRFRVVVFHQPAWSCGPHGSTEAVGERWVPVFERHRVALVLNGHDHDYERLVSRGGVTYVVTGGGGRELYRVRPDCMDEPHEPEQEAAAQRHHFVAVEVRSRSLLLRAVGTDGSVFDQTVIER
jgi:tartrate-resistant acid phosphatase type 5